MAVLCARPNLLIDTYVDFPFGLNSRRLPFLNRVYYSMIEIRLYLELISTSSFMKFQRVLGSSLILLRNHNDISAPCMRAHNNSSDSRGRSRFSRVSPLLRAVCPISYFDAIRGRLRTDRSLFWFRLRWKLNCFLRRVFELGSASCYK